MGRGGRGGFAGSREEYGSGRPGAGDYDYRRDGYAAEREGFGGRRNGFGSVEQPPVAGKEGFTRQRDMYADDRNTYPAGRQDVGGGGRTGFGDADDRPMYSERAGGSGGRSGFGGDWEEYDGNQQGRNAAAVSYPRTGTGFGDARDVGDSRQGQSFTLCPAVLV